MLSVSPSLPAGSVPTGPNSSRSSALKMLRSSAAGQFTCGWDPRRHLLWSRETRKSAASRVPTRVPTIGSSTVAAERTMAPASTQTGLLTSQNGIPRHSLTRPLTALRTLLIPRCRDRDPDGPRNQTSSAAGSAVSLLGSAVLPCATRNKVSAGIPGSVRQRQPGVWELRVLAGGVAGGGLQLRRFSSSAAPVVLVTTTEFFLRIVGRLSKVDAVVVASGGPSVPATPRKPRWWTQLGRTAAEPRRRS